MSHKKGFAKVLTMLMLVLTMFMAPFAQVAHANTLYEWSNGGSPSAANALATYILGNGVAGRSSGTRVSLEGISKINNAVDEHGNPNIAYSYGVNNDSNPLLKASDQNAIRAANNLKTLYEHGYIQAFDNGDDVGAKQGTLARAPAAL